MFKPRNLIILAALAGLAAPAAAQDVPTGIAAWQAGDYARAVAIWRPLAEAGEADAQFNLAQAFRLGRGAPQNLAEAEQWFERAARQRHEQAGASLGLLLFQNGRAREAMPWLQAAAARGDPRAQYVFGTALFNGDVVRRDLPRAYAMMRAAADQGFPQARAQIAEMERQLSPEDRARGQAMIAQIGTPAPTQVAVADTPPRPRPPVNNPPPPRREPTGPGVSYPHPPAHGSNNPPPPTQHAGPPPRRDQAGVSYPHPPEHGGPPPEQRAPVDEAPPRARPDRPERPVLAERPAPRPRPPRTEQAERAPASSGNWRVQIGAFSSDANARRQWNSVRSRVAALRGLSVSYQRAGSIIRVRAGGLPNRAAAERVCASVRASGNACVPVAP